MIDNTFPATAVEPLDIHFPLSFCPTGMVPTSADSPHVPLSPSEIVSQVVEVCEIGITSVHLHARDEEEKPAWRRDYFEVIIGEIRDRLPDLVICVTTSGRTERDPIRRGDVLHLEGHLKPDMASLTLSSLNFSKTASVNSPDTVQYLAGTMRDLGIKPELEIFDLGMKNYATYLAQKAIIKPPFVANFLFGGIASAQANLTEIAAMVAGMHTSSCWSLGGIGLTQTRVAAIALASGGGVRVGLEDNLYWDEARRRLATNQELVQRVVDLASLLGRKPMPSSTFRKRYLNGT